MISELRATRVQANRSLRDRALECGAFHDCPARPSYGVLLVASVLVIAATLPQPSIATAEQTLPRNLPDHSSEESAAKKNLRVLAYNVKHGRGNDGKVDLERTAHA